MGTMGKTPDAVHTLGGSNEGTDTVQSSITYTLPDGVENLTLTGTNAINGTGNALGNVITGNSGANTLTGGAGVDTLTGGAGADVFMFDDGQSSAATGMHDLITDFTPGTDKLDLAAIDAIASTGADDAFRFLGTAAFDGQAGALRYAYNAGQNVTVVSGDTNGDSAADFAIDLAGNKTLALSDFTAASAIQPLTLTGGAGADALDGSAVNDTLSGAGGNDTLTGLGGGDTLDGGADADTMIGGMGDDLYIVDDPGDVVTETSGPYSPPQGWTIKGTADLNGDGELDIAVTNGTDSNQLWLLANGTVSSVVGVPFFSMEWLMAGLADLNGDGKKDVLYQHTESTGQYGLYLNGTNQVGGMGHMGMMPDAVQALTGSNQGTDTIQSSVSYTLPGGVENLTLTGAGAINGTGNALGNAIAGNGGANSLIGGGGGDMLTGGAGADHLWGDSMGGAGTAGNDTFAFAPGSGVDTIYDFTAGGTVDQIDLVSFGFADFNAVMGAAQAQGGNVLINLGGGDSLTLIDVGLAELQSSDFLL
ncbi:MAG: M10 family metallopeptidase C-terminal domain-containing protein, partial [Rhodospirillales bacterium]